MGERQLVFTDSQGHKRSSAMGDHDHLRFSKAFDVFLAKHLSEENTTFLIERPVTEEVLTIETDPGIIGRTLDEAGAAREELLQPVDALGLRIAEAPAGAPGGEVRVRSDPRVDVELARWR